MMKSSKHLRRRTWGQQNLPRRARSESAEELRRAGHIGGVLLVAAVGLAQSSCITQPQPDIPQDAVVTFETLRYESPESEEMSQDATGFVTASQPLVGDISGARLLALGNIAVVNTFLFATLTSIDFVTLFPPSERGDDLWRWEGTNNEGITSRFDLNDQSEGAEGTVFGYRWQRRFESEDETAYRTGFDGYFERVGESDGRVRSGQGVVRYHFDELRPFDPDSATGEATVAFRSRNGVRQVEVYARDIQAVDAPSAFSSIFSYFQRRDRSGEFSFATQGDWFLDGAPLEDVTVRVVWDPSGNGRVLATVSGGSTATHAGGVDQIEVRECFSGSDSRTTWVDTTPDLVDIEGGAESECAPALQGLTLDPPATGVPPATGDPEIPGAHPDEAIQ